MGNTWMGRRLKREMYEKVAGVVAGNTYATIDDGWMAIIEAELEFITGDHVPHDNESMLWMNMVCRLEPVEQPDGTYLIEYDPEHYRPITPERLEHFRLQGVWVGSLNG